MKLLQHLFIIISFFLCVQPAICQVPPLDLSGLSPEEREMFEMFQNNTPEQNEELFMSIIEELDKEVSKLPPEEQEKFLENFWGEVEREAAQLEAKIKPIPEQTEPEQEPAPITPTPIKEEKKVPVQTSNIDNALEIIDSLLSKLENILRKSALIPDLSIKVQTWVKQGEIKPSFDSWQTLKNKIELFIKQLHKIKERDPKTKEYKYIVELLKNEVVLNNLSQVERVLRANDSNIEVPEYSSTQIKEKSSTALKNALTTISEAFYKLGIPASLDCIIEKYEPRAKQLKEEQEACIKEAQQINKGMVKVTPTHVAGYEPQAPKYQPMPKKSTYNQPSYYEPTLTSAPVGGFTKEERGGGSKESGKDIVTAPSKGDGASVAMPAKPTPAAGGKPMGKEESKKEEKKSSEKPEEKKEEKKKVEEDKRTEKTFDNLQSAVEKVTDAIIDRGFKDLQPQVLGNLPLNIPMAQSLQQIINTADRAVDKARAARLRFNKLSQEQKKYYSMNLNEILESAHVIEGLIRQIDSIKKQENNISDDKKWAFLGGKQVPQNDELIKSIPVPASIYDLQKSLQELMGTVKSMK